MSDKMTRFSLDELDRVRIVCTNCETAVEIPINHLEHTSDISCPVCSASGKTRVLRSITGPGLGGDPYAMLAQAVNLFQKSKTVRIEFLMPEEK